MPVFAGQQPRLPPGSCFEYYSHTLLSAPSGQAEGRLLVSTCTGSPNYEELDQLIVPIAPFRLMQPSRL